MREYRHTHKGYKIKKTVRVVQANLTEDADIRIRPEDAPVARVVQANLTRDENTTVNKRPDVELTNRDFSRSR